MKRAVAILAIVLAGCAYLEQPWAPLMTDERFATVERGMSRDDVRRLFGPPLRTMPFPLSGTDSWEYIGYDTWGYQVEYSVTFDRDGRVVSKLARRLNEGGDPRRGR